MVASNQARAFDPSQPAHLSAYDGQLERLAIQMRVRKGVGEMTAAEVLAMRDRLAEGMIGRLGANDREAYDAAEAVLALLRGGEER